MKKIFTFAIIAAVMLVMVAGCGGSSDPSQVIDEAYQQSQGYKTVHTEFNVELGINGDLSSIDPSLASLTPMNLTLKGDADVDMNEQDNPAVQGSVSIEGLDKILQSAIASSGNDEASSALGAGMISSVLSNMDFVLLNQVAYVNIMGTWYQTDMSSTISDATSSTQDVDTICIQDGIRGITPSQVLSGIEEVGSEDVDGESTTHYRATIDTDKMVDVAAQISRDCGQAEVAGGLEGAKSSMSDMFKKLDMEMWVDGDNNMRKVMLDAELDTAALAALGGTSTDSAELQALESLSVTMVVTATQSNFNEDVNITAPEGAVPLEDLLGGLGTDLGGGLGEDLGLGGGTSTGSSTGNAGSSTSTSPFSVE